MFNTRLTQFVLSLGLLASASLAHAVQTGPNPTLAALKADGSFAVSTQTISGSGQAFGSATVYSPNTAGKYALIAMCPGYVSAESVIQPLARRMATHGFVVVSITAKSSINWPSSRATQLLGALKAAAALTTGPVVGKIDATRQGVAGFSMGAGGTLEAAGKTPGLMAAMAWAPWHTTTTNIAKIKVATSIMVGMGDTVAPMSAHSQKFYNAIPSTTKKMLGVVQPADHGFFDNNGGEPAGYTMIAWAKRFADGDTRYSSFLPAVSSDWVSFTSTGPF
jgi:triacylglycerol lipase